MVHAKTSRRPDPYPSVCLSLALCSGKHTSRHGKDTQPETSQTDDPSLPLLAVVPTVVVINKERIFLPVSSASEREAIRCS